MGSSTRPDPVPAGRLRYLFSPAVTGAGAKTGTDVSVFRLTRAACEDGPRAGENIFVGMLRGFGGTGVGSGIDALAVTTVLMTVSVLLLLSWSISTTALSGGLEELEVRRLIDELMEDCGEVDGLVERVGTVGLSGRVGDGQLSDCVEGVVGSGGPSKRAGSLRRYGG